jgi:uncharacterized protein YbbC (DUF1343 family)
MPQKILLLLVFLIFFSCRPQVKDQPILREQENKEMVTLAATFQLGIDHFMNRFLHLVKDKRVALLTNPSGVNSQLRATSDILFENKNIHLVAFFGPEHGIRGAIHAGVKVADTTDAVTGLPVYSLYGNKYKPSRASLENIDVILVDIQDIGLRGYTYIYTMAKVMIAAAENNKKVIVLDRPNPLGGLKVEGNLVEEKFFSMVGLYPIPYRPGMTIGELARLFNEEYGIHCDLEIIPMQGWKRSMYWDATGLGWVPTSPHVPHWETILPMIATGTIGELNTLSEGVGYTSPFEIIGAPWIDGTLFAEKLNALQLPGIYFRPLYFKPYYLTYSGQICQGVQLHITDREKFSPYVTGLHILQVHMQLYPDQNLFSKADRIDMFNKVAGTDKIMKMLIQKIPVSEIEQSWQEELSRFLTVREKYLIY